MFLQNEKKIFFLFSLRIKKETRGGEVYWISYWILSHIPMKNKITISFSFFLFVVYLNVLINAICIWVHKKTLNSFIQANTYIHVYVKIWSLLRDASPYYVLILIILCRQQGCLSFRFGQDLESIFDSLPYKRFARKCCIDVYFW